MSDVYRRTILLMGTAVTFEAVRHPRRAASADPEAHIERGIEWFRRVEDSCSRFDEASEVRRLGLRYVEIPVSGADDLDRARVGQFGSTLDTARAEGGVLIHCASSNRVGAMVALDGMLNRGQPLDAALDRGRAAGLVSLEPAVVALARAESRT